MIYFVCLACLVAIIALKEAGLIADGLLPIFLMDLCVTSGGLTALVDHRSNRIVRIVIASLILAGTWSSIALAGLYINAFKGEFIAIGSIVALQGICIGVLLLRKARLRIGPVTIMCAVMGGTLLSGAFPFVAIVATREW